MQFSFMALICITLVTQSVDVYFHKKKVLMYTISTITPLYLNKNSFIK